MADTSTIEDEEEFTTEDTESTEKKIRRGRERNKKDKFSIMINYLSLNFLIQSLLISSSL